ncbi:hypothetical protein [Pyxidicoccus sp. MSG2]|uniref:hypothetical protein n=1 Tax=Pyxidicoccus sp. MSG2 TaxID=2996790 RepID=UPI00226EB68F|nr:hypothetical protein [Pyxidicoccus sp. MSG2]MCY1023974.1 hypothetical protein [Pyxidicoccus sp. MSG2]
MPEYSDETLQSTPVYIDEALQTWLRARPPLTFIDVSNRDDEVLLALARALFFASLGTEEKQATRVALVWHPDGARGLAAAEQPSTSPPREHLWDVLQLARRDFNIPALIKAAPLAEYGHSLLVVGGPADKLRIDGIAKRRPFTSSRTLPLLLGTDSPGSVTIAHAGNELFRYERGRRLPPGLSLLSGPASTALKTFVVPLHLNHLRFFRSPVGDTFQQLAVAMNRTGHGGLLLFLPTRLSTADSHALKLPVRNRTVLRDLLKEALRLDSALRKLEVASPLTVTAERSALFFDLETTLAELARWHHFIGRLTAIDNAVLLGPGFTILGAQYEVPSKSKYGDVYEVLDPEDRTKDIPYDMRRHGSRHRAAATFVAGGKGRIALLSSADGPLRCFVNEGGRILMWTVRLLDF